MESKEYTLYELNSLAEGINKLLGIAKSKKLNTKLVYNLTKNFKTIKSEIETIQEQFKDSPEGYVDYMTELQELALDCGGEKTDDGVSLQTDDFKREEFETKQEALNEKYSETLEKSEEVMEYNQNISSTEISDVELRRLKLDWFPETVTLDEIPYSIIDLIEE